MRCGIFALLAGVLGSFLLPPAGIPAKELLERDVKDMSDDELMEQVQAIQAREGTDDSGEPGALPNGEGPDENDPAFAVTNKLFMAAQDGPRGIRVELTKQEASVQLAVAGIIDELIPQIKAVLQLRQTQMVVGEKLDTWNLPMINSHFDPLDESAWAPADQKPHIIAAYNVEVRAQKSIQTAKYLLFDRIYSVVRTALNEPKKTAASFGQKSTSLTESSTNLERIQQDVKDKLALQYSQVVNITSELKEAGQTINYSEEAMPQGSPSAASGDGAVPARGAPVSVESGGSSQLASEASELDEPMRFDDSLDTPLSFVQTFSRNDPFNSGPDFGEVNNKLAALQASAKNDYAKIADSFKNAYPTTGTRSRRTSLLEVPQTEITKKAEQNDKNLKLVAKHATAELDRLTSAMPANVVPSSFMQEKRGQTPSEVFAAIDARLKQQGDQMKEQTDELRKEQQDELHELHDLNAKVAAPSSLLEMGSPDSFADIDAKLKQLEEKTKAELAKLQSDTAAPSSLLEKAPAPSALAPSSLAQIEDPVPSQEVLHMLERKFGVPESENFLDLESAKMNALQSRLRERDGEISVGVGSDGSLASWQAADRALRSQD